jgi:hypothetical protein
MRDEFFAKPKAPGEKVWSKEEILSLWPQAAGELRAFQKALEQKSAITADQLEMALQLAEAGIQRLLSYESAKSPEPIELGRTDCPLVVLRSHPDFPGTLSPELEGIWTDTNPAWPEETVKCILRKLEPPCHTDWRDFSGERLEERDGLKAFVVYVRPGPQPAA